MLGQCARDQPSRRFLDTTRNTRAAARCTAEQIQIRAQALDHCFEAKAAAPLVDGGASAWTSCERVGRPSAHARFCQAERQRRVSCTSCSPVVRGESEPRIDPRSAHRPALVLPRDEQERWSRLHEGLSGPAPAVRARVGANYGGRSVPAADGLGPLCAYRCDVVLGGPDLTIVVGFDGSPRAEDARDLGELLAVRGGARLVVVCVYVCRPVVCIESGEQARTRAARAGALLGRRCRWESCAVPARSVEEGLLAAADAERAVAIVVGSSRRRRGRRTRGERLVRRTADCAVTIAPLGYRARVDGFLDAHAALR